MHQVDQKKYNRQYFSPPHSLNYSTKIKPTSFSHKYKELAKLLKLKPYDHIVDYGCGNGNLSFYLHLKYQCQVSGFDYSHAAIKICREKLKMYHQWTKLESKINFQLCHTANLPKLTNIKAVYFSDVFEHINNQETKIILNQISTWNKNQPILIIAHTDNNLYLKYISWIVDLLSLITKTKKIEDLQKRKQLNKELHINLTNPPSLRKKMLSYGYKQIKLTYSTATTKKINLQMGIKSTTPISKTCRYLIKNMPFLSPSFYAIYKKT